MDEVGIHFPNLRVTAFRDEPGFPFEVGCRRSSNVRGGETNCGVAQVYCFGIWLPSL